MKLKRLTHSCIGALLCTSAAQADFIDLDVALWDSNWDSGVSPFSPDVGLVDTWRVYAQFDVTTQVTLVGVASDGTPMEVSNVLADGSPGTGFYTSAFGEPIPLNAGQATYSADQKANDHDTFLSAGPEPGYTLLSPVPEPKFFFGPSPGFGNLIDANGNTITLGNRAIIAMLPFEFADTRVLVGQFSVPAGEHVQGNFNLTYETFGFGGGEVIGATFTTIPAPGALVVLGAAGVLRRRHRRGADRC